ncbi:peptidylprolyl isomerase [Entomobacter blattae]|uniref:PpiC domain-containing protein n=1 Tax=Entomobacter blattae TaxID=2762277 RepID=A0A7H1NSF4_9PROT|nr:peptidylprolyl isomerase [Entomobacter blattae]QNT78714.1 hypothetical protein JGUZn3_14910 [Entomobacter blattae]
MLSFLRRIFVDSWLGRIMAVLVFIAFIGWGAGDVLTDLFNGSHSETVATMGHHTLGREEFSAALQKELAATAQRMGENTPAKLSEELRQQVARAVLSRLVMRELVQEIAEEYGFVISDDLLRKTVFSLPYFHDSKGQFDRKLFDSRIQQAGMNEKKFLDIVKGELLSQAVLQPIAAGVQASEELVKRAFAYSYEQRQIARVEVPMAAFSADPLPAESELHRFYINHPWLFSVPEFRKVRVVLLSANTIGRSLDISETQLRQAYDANLAHYNRPESRNFVLFNTEDQQKAKILAEKWKAGTPLSEMKDLAKKEKISVVEMAEVTREQIPLAELSSSLFGADVNKVMGPLKTSGGWAVFVVNKTNPAVKISFEQARKELHDSQAAGQAVGLLPERVQKLQDALAGGNSFDQLPADLGAAALEGTLNREGMTVENRPAPLPVSESVKQALLKDIFSAHKGDHPSVAFGPENTYYAIEVEEVMPAHQLDFKTHLASIRQAWQEQSRRHKAEQEATSIFLAARAQDKGVMALSKLPYKAVISPAFTRSNPPADLASGLANVVFALKKGESTMQANRGGYEVITLLDVMAADPSQQKEAYTQLQQSLTEAQQNEIQQFFVQSLMDREKPKINNKAVEQILAGFSGHS